MTVARALCLPHNGKMNTRRQASKPAMRIFIVGVTATMLANVAVQGLQVGALWQVALLATGAVLLGTIWMLMVYGLPRRRSREAAVAARWLPPPLVDPIERPGLLADLSQLLVDKDSSMVGLTTALVGAGGFGKTTLAIQVCWRQEVRARFPGGLLWATIGQEREGAELAAIVNDLSEDLDGERPQLSSPEQAGRHLGQLLTKHQPCLLVIDDVWTPAQLKPFTFGGAQTTRLVTTRIPGVLPTNTRTIEVDEMETDESKRLIYRGLPPGSLPEPTVEQLLRLTGNWPLLMAIVNGAIQRYGKEGSDPAVAARELASRLATEGPAVLDPRHEHDRDVAVRLTVAASVRLLPEPQPTRYFEMGIFAEDTEVPLDVLALLWRMTLADTRRLCEDLADLSLVRAYRRGSPTLQLHDVIRDHLRHELGTRLPDVNTALLDAVRSMLSSPEAGWWTLPPAHEYLWRHLTYHLAEAGRRAELRALVLDLRWGQEKIVRFGLPAYESDLARCDDRVAGVLSRSLARKGHLLDPIEPPHAHGDLLVSRLEDVPELLDPVAAYRATLATNVAHLTNRWPIPPVDPALLRVLVGHSDVVTGCVIDRNDRWLATTGKDQTVRIWSTTTWTERAVLRGHAGVVTGCAVDPHGSWLATTGADQTIRIWDTSTWTVRTVLRGHTAGVTGCSVARDGSWLATTGADRTVRIWRTDTWAHRHTLRGHATPVSCSGVARDGTWLATAGTDGKILIWSTSNWSTYAELPGHVGAVNGCAVARDGTWLATAGSDGTVRIWNAADWSRRTELRGHVGAVNGCAVAIDGTWLVSTGNDHTIRTWDIDSWTERAYMRGHTEAVTSCAVARDGTWLATTSADHNLRVWDTLADYRRGTAYLQNRPVMSCIVEPRARWLVAVGDDNVARVWNVDTPPTVRKTLTGHAGPVTDCSVDPVGAWVATASQDQTVRIWATDAWTVHKTLVGHTDRVMSCTFDSDGKVLASASLDGTVRIWDTSTWQVHKVLETPLGGVTRCSFARDGTWLAATGRNNQVGIWNTETWFPHKTLRGHQDVVTDCAFAPNGTWLATASEDRTVRIWSTSTWTEMAALTGHAEAVTGCSVSPDSAWLATTGGDIAVRIWEATTWEPAAAMRTNGIPHAVCWFPGSRAICVGAEGGIYQFTFTPPDR